MANTQLYGKDARAGLLAGVEKLNRAVSVTLGPGGRNVLFRHMGMIISTKDGVTVAKEINLSDVYESIGADLIKSAAGQTVDEAGDGTTTATLLAYHIFKAGVEAIDAGAEPTRLVRGIERATAEIVGEYDAHAKKFKGGILERMAVATTPELAYQAARISANGDDAIAKVVSDAVLRCGVDGAISIGNSQSKDHVLEFVDGMQMDNCGYIHQYFITDMKRNRALYENVTTLLINRRVSTSDEAASILECGIKAAQAKQRPVALLVFCDDMDPEALTVFVKNKVRPEMPIPSVVVRTPLWGDARRTLLEDIAVITGGRVIENPKGKHYESLTASDFGHAERVEVTGSKTTITAAEMTDFRRANEFDPHIESIKAVIADETMRPDQVDAAKNRLAALTGGVAVIKVGGTGANAVTETKFRVEDAIHATRAAVSDGVVPGGGSALLFASTYTYSSPVEPTESRDEIDGFELLLKALREPIRQIASNAGHNGESVEKQVSREESGSRRNGFDAATGLYLPDMIQAGIVDPLRVVRCALNAATSAAATTLLKTECVIAHDAANTPNQYPGR